MSGPAIAYHYRYPFASRMADEQGPELQLATFSDEDISPYFFQGRLRQPQLVAKALLGLVEIVRSRFFTPLNALPIAGADPIITSHGEFLRLEVFSQCCSVYARVDLPPEALEGETVGRGTTNVDFNAAMVAALARVRGTDDLKLLVGADEVVLQQSEREVVERRVQLPMRWWKGLTAVTSYAARLQPRFEVDGPAAVKFFRSVPKPRETRSRWWVQRMGRGLRIGQRAARDGVPLGGPYRLRVLEDLAFQAKALRVYGDESVEASGWELDFGPLRFAMVMTHDVWRGFSGEGQGLEQMAVQPAEADIAQVRAKLNWQAHLEPGGFQLADPLPVLNYLASQGLVGFDMRDSHYFHRQLPFDLELVSKLQPRLKAARKLVAEKQVQELSNPDEASGPSWQVAGTGTHHIVRSSGEDYRCTCPWFAKHQGQRGPCKHVLAVQIVLAGDKDTQAS